MSAGQRAAADEGRDRSQDDVNADTALVLTAIGVETEAVLRHLDQTRRERVGNNWFHVGRFGRWMVAIIEIGAGNTRAAAIASRALVHFKPEVAAFVGVAGRVKDADLGDVVVASRVYGYESGKETRQGFHPRPDVQTSHHELEQRARALRTDDRWHTRLNSALGRDRKPVPHIGPIAAGEAVVAHNRGRIATFLSKYYGDTLAVEMEGRGFLEAIHIDAGCRGVVVRGISDRLRGKRATDQLGWQQRAADAASAFFFAMLALDDAEPEGTAASAGKIAHTQGVFLPDQLGKTMANPRYADDISRLDRVYDRKAVINRETIIIVIGKSVPVELLDRPVAEMLRDEIDRRGGKEHPFRRAIVLTDQGWYAEAPDVALNAVIAVGSRRANELTKKFEDEPAPSATKFSISDREGCNGLFQKNAQGLPQVALWGEYALKTREAVDLYIKNERGLDEFLRITWK